ncbi:MAG: hypothetical protein RL139_1379 [Gemmatimonadota bacterium]
MGPAGERYADRVAAGQALAAALTRYAHRADAIVLGLPRGGVPVAAEVARALGLPLDVLCVRKLGVPWQEELAMGAVAPGGVTVLDRAIIQAGGIPEAAVTRVIAQETRELTRREQAYRAGRPPLDCGGRTVLLVDDGLATGATMRAAIRAVRRDDPAAVIVAVPVAPASTCAALQDEAETCLCLATPAAFAAVGEWYAHFPQVSDAEVVAALAAPPVASRGDVAPLTPSP